MEWRLTLSFRSTKHTYCFSLSHALTLTYSSNIKWLFIIVEQKSKKREKNRSRHAHIFIQLSLSDIDYAYVCMYMIVLFHSNIKLCTSNRFQSLGSIWNIREYETRSTPGFWICSTSSKEKEEKKTTMTTTCACTTTLHSIAVRQNRINEKEETSASAHIHKQTHCSRGDDGGKSEDRDQNRPDEETWRTTNKMGRRKRTMCCQQTDDDDAVSTSASTQGSRIISHSKSNWHLS
jgi:hypothetical protein